MTIVDEYQDTEHIDAFYGYVTNVWINDDAISDSSFWNSAGFKSIGINEHLENSLVKYLASKILDKIQGTEMLVDLENLGTR